MDDVSLNLRSLVGRLLPGAAAEPHGASAGGEAERELTELLISGARYPVAGGMANFGIWFADGDGDCRHLGRPFLDLVGMTLEQVRRVGWVHLLPPEDRQPTAEQWRRCVETGENWELAHRVWGKDGTYRRVLSLGRPVRDERGEIASWVGLHVDLGEQAETEQPWAARARVVDAALSSIVDFAYVFDSDGRFRYANRALLDLWGLTLAQAVGKNFFDLNYPAELAAKLQRQIREVFETGRPLTDETPYVSPAGVAGYYEYIFTPVFAGDGTVEAVAGSTRDITRRKSAEDERESLRAALEAERSKLAGVIEHAPAFICTLRGPDHVFEIVNERYYEIVGRRELIGRSVREALPEVEGQGFFELLDNVYRTGETFTGNEMPVRLDRGGAGSLDLRFMTLVYQAMRGAEGCVSGIFVHGVDVTDLVRSRELIRESESRFRLLADSMPQIVWAARPDGVLDYYNRRWFEYINLPAVAGEQASTAGEAAWDRHIHPEDLPRAYEAWTACLRTGAPYTIEFRVRRADGAYRWFLVRALPAAGAGGDVARWYGTCTDVQDQRALRAEKEHLLDRERAARAEAEAANQAKDRHLAFLAHELRGPLTPALLAATSMAADASLPAGLRVDAAMIRRNIELTTRLADDLLDANRIALGKLELREEPTDVHATLGTGAAICAADAAAKGVRLTLEPRAARAEVVGDPAKLTQVWTNLIKNAVKFSHAGGTVTVRTSDAAGGRLRVEVEDVGVGVDPDLLPKIFDLYEQGGSAVTREHAGLGLGLAICRGIVDAHGGTITASSGGRGRGTTLTVELPDAVAGAAPRPVNPGVLDSTATGEPAAELKILLVDDHEDTLRVMSRLLGRLKHRVTTATSVGTALSAASVEEFDLLISDIGLPDGSGMDLMRELLKKQPIRGIALTGYGTESDIRQTEAAGFEAHITKPIDFQQLEALIPTPRPKRSAAHRTGRP